MFRNRISRVLLCPLPLVLSLGTTGYCPFRYFCVLMRSTLNLIFSRLRSLSFQPFLRWEMLQSFNHSRGPFVGLFPVAPNHSYWRAWNCMKIFRCGLSAEQRAGSPPFAWCQGSSLCSPGYCQHSLLQGCIADSRSACPPALPRGWPAKLLCNFQNGKAGWCSAYTGAQAAIYSLIPLSPYSSSWQE